MLQDAPRTSSVVVDCFAGPGGWTTGLLDAGWDDVVGVELDADACATREAAGHRVVRADVAVIEPQDVAPGPVAGLTSSPPCQPFSIAGHGAGRKELARLGAAVSACRDGWSPPGCAWAEPGTPLVLEPLRWVWALRPGWVACEQVPPVLPLWEQIAEVLRGWGYRAACAVVNCADLGLPQTRRRALLVASRTGPATLPEPTHTDGVADSAPLFGEPRLPWVPVRDVLGFGRDSGAVLRTGTNSMVTGRTLADLLPYERSVDQPAPTVDAKALWAWKVGSPRSFPPSRPRGGGTRPDPAPEDALFEVDRLAPRPTPATPVGEPPRHVTLAELGEVQGFPPGYPFAGNGASVARQVGNAVPPPLASAVVQALAPRRADGR